jgi:type I restriction enzyme S subunit
MAGEWRHTKLGDVVEINPEALGSDWPYDHIRYVDISSVGEGFLIELPRHLIITDAPSRAKRLVRSGDTILSTVRPNRRSMYFVKESSPDLVVSTGFAVLRPRENLIEPRYLYACVFDKNFTEYLVSREKGAAYPAVLPEDIADAVINLPPLPEQRAIAAVLGALDDKIELNRRMNRTLESIAQAVFREMMKDEGGRMNGRETTIGEVVTVVGGTTPSTTNSAFWGGDICWATPKDLASLQSPILLDTNSRITELGLQEISSGILPAGTVLLSSRAPIGYVAITHIPVAINQGFIAIKCTDEVPNYFILNWLKDNMEEIIGRANGTTFLEISKSNFRTIPIFIPPVEKMKNFVEIVEPIYQKIVANLKQSRTLAALRDALLPKLMRAEVRVAVHE